ncbi:MAG: fused MFS/spermidine synthase [Deltaproteobacteria bacterium]|nr:fused MFS/spermidine synthase [Deltaproteobacteria bacterium]
MLRFLLLLSCFFLSGVAGLIYQTVWSQQFALIFGTSELAVATVLSAYMAGLALGAAVVRRRQARVSRPIRVYAFLELGIALTALLVPTALHLARHLQELLLGGHALLPTTASSASVLFYVGVSFVVVVLPTGLMGATLPLLVRDAVLHDAHLSARVSLLYTANTLGAAVGTLLTGFVLLPTLGLTHATFVAVGLNGVVCVAAVLLAYTITARTTTAQSPTITSHTGESPKRWILPLILLSGVVSFTYEVLWTRLFTHLLGSSVYAFSTMLATVLLGLALGAMVVASVAMDERRARVGFMLAQLGCAVGAAGTYWGIDFLPDLMARFASDHQTRVTLGTWVGALLLLPSTMCIGATFPFAVRLLAPGAAQAAEASAHVFTWNTLGAIIGALGAGFVLLPTWQFSGTVMFAVSLSLLLACGAAVLAQPRHWGMVACAGVGLGVLVLLPPQTPWAVLRHNLLGGQPQHGAVAYLGVGRSTTVFVTEQDTGARLTTNGLPESMFLPHGERAGRFPIARWLSLLPLAARPETKSLLVVGLGAGLTVEDVPPSVDTISVVELEPEVVHANRLFAPRRDHDPLVDPRVRVHLNDARGALLLTQQRFDAIVSQPSHPWTVGASQLFTREFFQLVRDRLQPRGVFVQWIGLDFIDEPLLRSLLATLHAVFPHVELYQPVTSALLFLASAEPLTLDRTVPQALASAPAQWGTVGVRVPEDVLVTRRLDTAGVRAFARDAPVCTDEHNLVQLRSPRVLERPVQRAWAPPLLLAFDPLRDVAARLDTVYLVQALIARQELDRAQRVVREMTEPGARRTAYALTLHASGQQAEAERALWSLVTLDPNASVPRQVLLALSQEAVARGVASAQLMALARTDPEAVVAEGWRHAFDNDWAAVRLLEVRLAAVEPHAPLCAAAVRLRIGWRVHSGQPSLANEALTLLTPFLGARVHPRDLLLRAQAGLAVADAAIVFASLMELRQLVGDRPEFHALVAQGQHVLAQLPASARTDPRYARLTDAGAIRGGTLEGEE